MNIQFQAGRPSPFITTRPFALGATGITVPGGSEILFDGTMVQYAGQNIGFPQLRGAIRMGWVVPAEDYDPNDDSASRPQPAGIQLRTAAQGGNPMDPANRPRPFSPTMETAEGERPVGNVRAMAKAAQDRNQNRTYRTGSENRALSAAEASRMPIESQDGVPVRTLNTPVKNYNSITADNVGSQIQQATSSGRIQPGRGMTEEEMLAGMTPDEQAEYLHTKNSRKAAYVDVDQTSARQIVGSVAAPKSRQSEGFTVNGSVGGGVETADLGGTGGAGKAQESVMESEGMVFRTTNGPKKDVRQPAAPVNISGTEDARRKIAKMVCPDFPELYNFDDPVRKKIARIQADFEDRPDVIKAIFAAENDEMKQRLLTEFPDVFA